jgi:hypothetical protein
MHDRKRILAQDRLPIALAERTVELASANEASSEHGPDNTRDLVYIADPNPTRESEHEPQDVQRATPPAGEEGAADNNDQHRQELPSAADRALPSTEAHLLEDVTARYGVRRRTLDRWLNDAAIKPHRDAVDARRRYLTSDEVALLNELHGTSRKSRVNEDDQDEEVLARVTQVQEELKMVNKRLARLESLDANLDAIEEAIDELTTRVRRSVKELTKVMMAALAEREDGQDSSADEEP